MRPIARVGLLTAMVAASSAVSAREPFRLEGGGRPTSIKQVSDTMRGDDPETTIPLYLEGAQCGGWDKEIEVGEYIATVRELPGRRHDWSGDIRSGMGTRIDADGNGDPDDDYEFPDTTEGLTTACEQGRDRIWKEVWIPGREVDTLDGPVREIVQEWQEFAHPYFEDPPCQWRIKVGRFPPEPLARDEFFEFDKDGWEYEDRESCQNFCGYLNSFFYGDCVKTRDQPVRIADAWDGDGNVIGWHWELVKTCEEEGQKYICTDQKVEHEDREKACTEPHPDVEEWANARKCVGEQCRCPNEEDEDACLWTQKDEEAPKQEYQSYYRLYAYASYSRNALNKNGDNKDIVPEDDHEKELMSTCFGFYDEFDPKTHLTKDKDRRCVINIDVEDMRESQVGKAEFKEKDVDDKDPTDEANQRPGGPEGEDVPPDAEPVPGHFNKDIDTWYKKLGSAFSLVNEKLFKDQYESDLGNVYLAFDELDDGAQTATPQISEEKLFAESNLMRAFDDTGNPRAYVRWWQEQQTRMAALMRPPVLRIILPSAWFMGLDPNDPFLTAQSGSEDATERADRSDRIELQVEADEDMIGTALAYLERSVLLHVEEEPIPIVVPMGSPAEFRARAADWCAWYKGRNGVKTCDDAPEELKELMERLEEYAKRIDEYRELRAEIAQSAGAVLDLQRRLLEPIAGWFKQNEQRLQELVRGRDRVERDLLPLWRLAQQQVALMHEQSNLPWCMNQRFTSPTYSLLDPWLRSRAIGDDDKDDVVTNELDLPTLPLVERPQDVIIDFSAVVAMSGTLKLPVLKPIQIRIEIPAPPAVAELAELPPVGDVRAALADAIGAMPEVRNGLVQPPTMEPPAPLSGTVLGEANAALSQMAQVTRSMNERYAKFWKSIGPLRPLDGNSTDEDRELKENKERMRCKDWNEMPCEHVEMDLLERVQRIGSRPLVQLKQDFESIGTPRSEATVCLPEDDACHILNSERTDPGFRWEVLGSRANDAPIDELKLKILKLTLPEPIGTLDRLLRYPYDEDPSPMQSFPSIRLTP